MSTKALLQMNDRIRIVHAPLQPALLLSQLQPRMIPSLIPSKAMRRHDPNVGVEDLHHRLQEPSTKLSVDCVPCICAREKEKWWIVNSESGNETIIDSCH